MMNRDEDDGVVKFEDAIKKGETRILFTGPRRSGKSSIEKAEVQIKKQIQQHITNLALKRVTSQLQDFMTPGVQSKLIDANISQLGGQI